MAAIIEDFVEVLSKLCTTWRQESSQSCTKMTPTAHEQDACQRGRGRPGLCFQSYRIEACSLRNAECSRTRARPWIPIIEECTFDFRHAERAWHLISLYHIEACTLWAR